MVEFEGKQHQAGNKGKFVKGESLILVSSKVGSFPIYRFNVCIRSSHDSRVSASFLESTHQGLVSQTGEQIQGTDQEYPSQLFHHYWQYTSRSEYLSSSHDPRH